MSTPPSPSPTTSSLTAPSPTPSTSPTTSPPLRPLYLTLLLTCPLLALLPPRKLDLYTFSLTGAWILSAEELVFSSARRTGNTGVMGVLGRAEMSESASSEQMEEVEEAEGEGVKGLAKKLWMGDERSGWQKRRVERQREELEAGKGYGEIIMEQVREVFPGFGGGRREGEEDGEGD